MPQAIPVYADSGCNLILDYITYVLSWQTAFEKVLSDISHICVKMSILFKETKKKKLAGGALPIGHVRTCFFSIRDAIYGTILSWIGRRKIPKNWCLNYGKLWK
jgi:hypothetical protein